MIISLIIDPTAMDSRYFSSIDGYRFNMNALFDGLSKNGVLVVDENGFLERELSTCLSSLPIKYRQELQIRLEELLKNKRKRIIKADAKSGKGDIFTIMSKLNELYDVDAVCLSDDTFQVAEGREYDLANALSISSYLDSEVERRRRSYLSELPPLHKLSVAEVEDFFIRSVRYSKWLRFYDKQIGKGSNLKGFFRGIDFILSTWADHGVFSREQSRIEIITSTLHYLDNRTYDKEQKREENFGAIERVQKQLIGPLQKKYRDWEIVLRVKNASPTLFHARYLEAQFLILGVDRGFDFFERDGDGFVECSLNIRNGDALHLAELRALPDLHC